MKVLSLWQPWASLIADGRKRIETRSWAAPRWIIDRDILIHATKRIETDAAEDFDYLPAAMPRGALICVVHVDACVRFDQESLQDLHDHYSVKEFEYGDFEIGRFGWILSKPRKIIPVEIHGYQGIFSFNGQVQFA